MKISLNGEEREARDGTTVASLLAELGLEPAKVAVERNREVVPKSAHASAALREGDAVEIIHFIGGG
jgi:thiamine biosynthesis protein ThiS